MKKIVLITPMLQPYRISFYEKLAFRDPTYRWKVFHGVSRVESGRPNYKGETRFENTGFREYKFRIGPFTLVYNKGMFGEIRRFDPDLVILQGIAGDISNRRITAWARRKKKKIILWTCGWEPGIARRTLLSFKNYLVSTMFRKADLHLTYSSKANQYVEDMGVGPERIHTCYNGIETDHLLEQETEVIDKSREIVEKYSLTDHITFIYVGGLLPEKKVELLLEAFRNLRRKYNRIKLIIIGDGPSRDQIQSVLSGMNDSHIFYLGRIINGVDSYFAASDCLVLPGTGGLALNQAMFWRKTCIVSEADGTEDDLVIEKVSGYRFLKDDIMSLEDAMERRIKTSQEDVERMSHKAREIIDTKSNVNHMVKVFYSGIEVLLK